MAKVNRVWLGGFGQKCMHWLAFGFVAAATGCAYDTSSDFAETDVESVSDGLYDSADLSTTGRLALRDALARMRATGSRYEYCGLVVRKANGQFRAGAPVTQNLQTFCSASISLSSGESVVGYYHTHPAGVEPWLSPEDISAAESSSRHYFLAGNDGCGYRYDPFTNITWHLGCPF